VGDPAWGTRDEHGDINANWRISSRRLWNRNDEIASYRISSSCGPAVVIRPISLPSKFGKKRLGLFIRLLRAQRCFQNRTPG
jgi:hypothetical protein